MAEPDLDPLATDDDELTIRGELDNTSVPDLLRSLLGSGESGVLTVHNGDITKHLTIKNGRVVNAASSDPDERLGECLLVAGKITARQYLEAGKMIRPGRRLGTILVELDALESDELIPAVGQHVKAILTDLFTWTHGTYELVMKEIDTADFIAINASTENLILDGIRHNTSWSQVLRSIGDIGMIPVNTGATDILYKLDLTSEEQEVLAHVTGRATVEQICEVSYLSHFETCRILWAFLVLGLIRRSHAGEAAALGAGVRAREEEMDLEAIVEKFNQMFGRIYTFLQGRVGPRVDDFMESALAEVSRQYGVLFGGVDLKQYGRADFDQLLANVADLPAEQRKSLMVSGLNELVFVIQLAVHTSFGPEEEAVAAGIIKEGLRRMGPGKGPG